MDIPVMGKKISETKKWKKMYKLNQKEKKMKHGYKKTVQGEITFLNSNEKKIVVRIS